MLRIINFHLIGFLRVFVCVDVVNDDMCACVCVVCVVACCVVWCVMWCLRCVHVYGLCMFVV